MRLDWLHLHNYLPYGDVEWEPKDGITEILGQQGDNTKKSNQTGKTSLIRGLRYLLFGRDGKRTVDRLVRRGETSMLVEGRLSFDGDTLEIKRGRSGAKSIFSVTVNKIPVEGKTAVQLQAELERRLGLTYDTFMATCFFAQAEADAFTSVGPAKRKEYLREILDLVVFDRARERAINRGKELGQKIAKVEAELVTGVDAAMGLGIANGNLVIQKKTLADGEEKLSTLEAERAEFAEIEKRLVETAKAVVERSAAQGFHTDATTNYAEASKTTAARQKSVDEVTFKRVATSGLIHMEERLGVLQDSQSYGRGELKRIRSRMEGLEALSGQAACSTCKKPLTEEERLRELSAATQDGVELAGGMGRDAAEAEKLQGEVDTIHKAVAHNKASSEKREERLKLLKEAEEVEARHVELLKERTVKLQQAEQALSDVRIQGDVNPTRSVTDIDKDLKTARDLVVGWKADVQTTEKAIADLEAQIEKEKGLRAKLEPLNEELSMVSELIEVFGKDGASAAMMGREVPQIEAVVNDMLADLDPEKRVHFEMDKELKTGERRDSFEIIVSTSTGPVFYEDCSGGAQTLLNFAIRLGLSWYLANRTGTPIYLVILDETFSALDVHNREMISRMLRLLRSKFLQIFMISHTTLSGVADQEITAINEEGVARLEAA
jgi:DNA repair exonuclease SbcCD ATPase subunit